MGTLTVVVGPVTGQTSFNNAAGAAAIRDLVQAYPELGVDVDTASDQAIMDAYIQQLRNYTVEVAFGWRKQQAEFAAGAGFPKPDMETT